MRRSLVLVAVLNASLACADTPLTSPRPMPNPQDLVATVQGTINLLIKPQPRPNQPAVSLQPVAALPKPPAPRLSLTGSVCGNPAIKGKPLKPITSRIKGCNVPEPVLVSSVAGVALSPAATINCAEAVALSTWVSKGLQPNYGNQVSRLTVVDSYACRPRNNVRGAKISEHGTGNAIDIAGWTLKTGKTYTVSSNYTAQMRKAQRAACGIFHTTLGPGSDGYHENHLHFDVASYRGNPYCQ